MFRLAMDSEHEYNQLAFDYSIAHEKSLRDLCRLSCRGRYDLIDEIFHDVVLVRLPFIIYNWGEADGGFRASLNTHVQRNLRWYIFKYLNARMRRFEKRVELDENLPGECVAPLDAIANADEVQSIIAGLTSAERRVLLLYNVHGFNFSQLATALGCSVGHARGKYLEALEHAKQIGYTLRNGS